MKRIILASSSPRRKDLLKQIGLDFDVVPSNIEEILNPRLSPHGQTKRLSEQKAKSVSQNASNDSIVLAADTLVVLGKEILGKPDDKKHAKRMLRKLQNTQHSVVTGFTVIDVATGKTITDSVETRIWMRKLSDKEITSYIANENVMDKAGAYAIQGLGSLLFEKIEGDYSNVLGLPIVRVATVLRKFGVRIF